MKYTINIQCLLLLLIITLSSNSFAQGIRKHYTELTNDERIAYKTAIENLDNLGIREEYADYHADPDDNGVNGNMSGSSAIHGVQEFLPWHRQFILEFERELQNQNEYLTIPYWDWTGISDPSGVNSSSNIGPLWANNQISSLGWSSNFLGEYDILWSLGRDLVAPPSLPTVSQVSNILASSSFSSFRIIEGSIHGIPHVWVDGQMGDMLFSPRDPIFYFHHAMVDKIWQDWEVMPGNNSSFTDNVMPTFDGTVAGFDFVNQNAIVDSRDLGVFYSDAINQVATLEMYTVSNANTTSEKFGYQYEIEAKDNFVIPAGKNAEFRSCTVIKLLPGFEATNGSVFHARIDSDCNFSTAVLIADNNDSGESTDNKADESNDEVIFKNYPNPFTGHTTIEFTLLKDTPVTLVVSDVTGRQIAVLLDNEQRTQGTHLTAFDGSKYAAGMYYYTIQAGEYTGTKKMILVK